MTTEELKELFEKIAQSQAKTDEQMAETDRKLKKLSEMYGGASNNQGKVAEEFFYNSLRFKPEIAGIQFDFVMKNVNRSKGNLQEEYDIILVNGNIIYLVEVKYNLHKKDIDIFHNWKLPNFRMLFPEYKDFDVRVAFASFSIEEDLKKYAHQIGVTLLQRRGDVFETLAA